MLPTGDPKLAFKIIATTAVYGFVVILIAEWFGGVVALFAGAVGFIAFLAHFALTELGKTRERK
ncbi:hypothetical protein [Sinorhizobium arboris]|uniref:hypothetical protein n=1 Tax=Sinorhizobium arboris TaxID=76745 RepID=UPI00040B8DA6|nr:hypothetical protein [Sinorhizobium arboris]